MNANRIAQIIRERNRYRHECQVSRVMLGLLFTSCAVVVSLDNELIAALMFLAACLLIGSLAFLGSALFIDVRGNKEMGIGDTQGRGE